MVGRFIFSSIVVLLSKNNDFLKNYPYGQSLKARQSRDPLFKRYLEHFVKSVKVRETENKSGCNASGQGMPFTWTNITILNGVPEYKDDVRFNVHSLMFQYFVLRLRKAMSN